MCARAIKLLFLTLIFCGLSSPTHARTATFASKSGFGLYFKGGASNNPKNDFATANPANATRSYTMFGGFEPGMDFGNFGIRANASMYLIPDTSGNNTDTVLAQAYRENTELSVISYGGALLFFPHYTEGKRGRIYFGMGGGLAMAFHKATRTYLDGAGNATATYEVKGRSSTEYWQGILGYEFFMVQNYTFQLEAGYRTLSFNEFEYKSSNNIQGTTVNQGTTIKTPAGIVQSVGMSGIYMAASFGIQF